MKQAQLMFGKVAHSRLFPRRNTFCYGIYYLHLPLSDMTDLPIAYNRFSGLSFYDKDHGACDGSDLNQWAQNILKENGINEKLDITLMCMPRIFGYVFNPVSFWLCRDKDNRIKAVLCEVHNTFGERHTYLCAHEDLSEIESGNVLAGKKIFHVSPFLERQGHYSFRFMMDGEKFGAWIDFYDESNVKQLTTSLIGVREPMNKKTKRRAFWGYPLITFKAIALIHWQALKIVTKGIKYIPKPKQLEPRLTMARRSTDKIL